MTKQGFTLVEMLVTLGCVLSLLLIASQLWNWSGLTAEERAYSRALEEAIHRSINYAQDLEQPVAVCFALNDVCTAEGALTPIHLSEPDIESDASALEWHLLEALPKPIQIILRSNFPNDQLLIHAHGQTVQQPGSIYICPTDSHAKYYWRITISRSAKVSTQKLNTADESEHACI